MYICVTIIIEEEVMGLRGSGGVGGIEGRKGDGGNHVSKVVLYVFSSNF